MANLTNEQIEQKKQQLKQLAAEVKALHDELVEAGAIELSEDALDGAAGGYPARGDRRGEVYDNNTAQPGKRYR